MAKTIIEDEQLSSYSLRTWGRVILFGAIVGALYWLLAWAIGRFIVEPLTCRQLVDAASCVDATAVAGKIATVVAAAVAIFGMVRFGVVRPIIIAVASAFVLWSLSSYTLGLHGLESFAWSVGLYAITYALFGWIARAAGAVIAVVFAVLVAVIVRIALVQ